MAVRGECPSEGKAAPRFGDGRDLRLDLLRGFAVLAMVVDHIGGVSPLHAITGGNRFFVSAAEGFVFISGLLVGIVYGGELRRNGWWAGAKKSLRRALALYALSVWLAVGFALASTLLGLPWAMNGTSTSFGELILRVATFQRTYYLVDVMQLYTLLLLATPLALWLLSRRSARLLLEGSVALWLAYQLTGGRPQIPWRIEDNVAFNFAPWQILFFSAMTLGYERDAVASWWQQRRFSLGLGSRLPGGWLGPLAAAIAGLVWLHVTDGAALGRLGLTGDPASTLDAWFDKASLPPLRLLASAVVFAFAWNLVSRGWPMIRPALGWLLLPLGGRALYAYSAHVFIVGAIQAALPLFVAGTGGASAIAPGNSGLPPGLSFAAQAAAVAAAWAVVRWEMPRRVFSRLGGPPFVRAGVLNRARIWRPTASLVAFVGLCVVGWTAADLKWSIAMPPSVLASAYASAEGGVGPPPRPVPTVTPKRRIADLAPNPGQQLRSEIGAAPAPPPAASVPPRLARAATTSVLDDRSLNSRILGRTMPYGLYLPPGYVQDCSRRYPVVYLLHGAPNNYTEWPHMGIREVEDGLIASGGAQPMIMVFPQGEGSYFFNHQGGPAWGDYIARDVVGQIDATLCTIPDRARRVIAGLSAGGQGALQLVLNYPDVFGIVAAHGPALRRYEERSDLFGSAAYYRQYDPLALAQTAGVAPSKIWLDAGDKDPWAGRVLQLAGIFQQRGWSATTRIYPGEHGTGYWLGHLAEYLQFYSESLGR